MSKPAGSAIQYPALAWETAHPERAEWSRILIDQISLHYDQLAKAQDQSRIHPMQGSFGKSERIRMFAEFMVALAYYESGWDQAASDVDVGSHDDRGSYSDGLWQVSANDQEWAAPDLHYSPDALLRMEPNAVLAIRLLARQVDRTGKIFLPNSHRDRYWATLLDGNKYQKIEEISRRVQAAMR